MWPFFFQIQGSFVTEQVFTLLPSRAQKRGKDLEKAEGREKN